MNPAQNIPHNVSCEPALLEPEMAPMRSRAIAMPAAPKRAIPTSEISHIGKISLLPHAYLNNLTNPNHI
jgi:hypothetical protein